MYMFIRWQYEMHCRVPGKPVSKMNLKMEIVKSGYYFMCMTHFQRNYERARAKSGFLFMANVTSGN